LNWTYDDSADVLWFDFCDNNLIAASRDDKEYLKKKKVIARLHSVEYYMGFHHQIDWSCVDDLIFVSDHMRRLCGELPVKTHVIPNGIDIEALDFIDTNLGYITPKPILGYAGNIVNTKGILLMFNYFKELLNHNRFATLKMVGLNRFSGREGEYYQHYKKKLGDKITEGDEVGNIDTWLDGVDFLWQPSLAESFSIIIGEALAKGIPCLINDFYGAKELWPNNLIYDDFTSFYNIINSPHDSKAYRQFVEERYSLDSVMEKIKCLL